jgi:hypothetical protein
MKPSSSLMTVALAMACLSGPVAAQYITLDELKSKNPVRLDKGAVEGLVSGATSESLSRKGSKRSLQNMTDGRLVGSVHGSFNRGAGTSAEGKWRVEGDRYCVDIAWTGNTYTGAEKWCAPIMKVDDDYYFMYSKDATKVSFTK